MRQDEDTAAETRFTGSRSDHIDHSLGCPPHFKPSFKYDFRLRTSSTLTYHSFLVCQTTQPSSAPRLKPHQHIRKDQSAIAPGPTNRHLPPRHQLSHNTQSAIVCRTSHETHKLDSQTAMQQQQPPLHRMPPTLRQFQPALVERRSSLANIDPRHIAPPRMSATTHSHCPRTSHQLRVPPPFRRRISLSFRRTYSYWQSNCHTSLTPL